MHVHDLVELVLDLGRIAASISGWYLALDHRRLLPLGPSRHRLFVDHGADRVRVHRDLIVLRGRSLLQQERIPVVSHL